MYTPSSEDLQVAKRRALVNVWSAEVWVVLQKQVFADLAAKDELLFSAIEVNDLSLITVSAKSP